MAHMSTSEQLARINPDSKPVLYLVLAVTTVIAAVAFAVSFAGLAAVSQWAQIPPRLSWALPVFIDGAILGFTIMILVFRARGESTIFAWIVLIAFTLISVAANSAHAYAEGQPGDWRTILGSGLAGLAPAGLAVFIHGIARLLVISPGRFAHRAPGMTTESTDPLASTSLEGGTVKNGVAARSAPRPDLLSTETVLRQRFANDQERSVRTGPNGIDSEPQETVDEVRREERIQANGRGGTAEGQVRPRQERIDQAIALHQEGMSQKAIGERLGVSRATVGRWIRTRHTSDVDRSSVARESAS